MQIISFEGLGGMHNETFGEGENIIPSSISGRKKSYEVENCNKRDGEN